MGKSMTQIDCGAFRRKWVDQKDFKLCHASSRWPKFENGNNPNAKTRLTRTISRWFMRTATHVQCFFERRSFVPRFFFNAFTQHSCKSSARATRMCYKRSRLECLQYSRYLQYSPRSVILFTILLICCFYELYFAWLLNAHRDTIVILFELIIR